MSLLGSTRPLDTVYDTALLDLDGVVYIGSRPVPAAAEAVGRARAAGMGVAFVTNNALRTPAAVAELLSRMSIPADAEDVVTSAQAAARLVARRCGRGSRVLALGDMGLRAALHRQGLRPVSTAAERPAAVVEGFSPRKGYDAISEGCLAVSQGALYVITNADLSVPSPRGLHPGNGSVSRIIAKATGREPIVAGKPEPPLHEEAVLRSGARRPLVVGDLLATDIEGANRRSADSLLVLSGVTTPADVVLAPPQHRPRYIAADLGGLNSPHPAPEFHGGIARCGGWWARAENGGGVELNGSGDRSNALRALCTAVWSASPPADAAAVASALAHAGF